MAHKKGAGSTDNGRDSAPQYLGVKKFGGEVAKAGNILVRQRGTKFHAGVNVYMSKDHTLHASVAGVVCFKRSKEDRRIVYIMPTDVVPEVREVLDVKPKAPKAIAAPKATVAKAAVAAAPKAEPVIKTVVEASKVVVEAPKVEVVAEPVVIAPKVEAIVKSKPAKADDLKKIEGIGPKIEELLHEAGIKTFAELSVTPAEKVKEILDAAGPRFAIHNPATWAKQAELAAEGKWVELKAWQDELDGGKE